MKTPHLLLTMLLLFSLQSFSQDLILKKNDEMIKCKIKEVGINEVKYILPDYPQDVMFSLDKDKISKIVFENGEELAFQKEITNPANYTDNHKNVIKIGFLSPLMGNTSFAWEHSLRPGRSIEATLGLVGLGLDAYDENPAGGYLKFGYKFIKDPDFYLQGMRYAHILKGSYIKPEISLGLVARDIYYWDDYYDINGNWQYNNGEKRVNTFAGAIQLVFGKQWVFDNIFAVDGYGGVGYGFSSSEENADYDAYQYGFIVAPSEFPISFSAGLKIGLLIK